MDNRMEACPFQDGNGRPSRILTTLLLLRSGYAYVAYSSLESIVEQTKKQYYLALRKTQGTIRLPRPNWHPWLKYFLGALVEQKSRLGLRRIKLLRAQWNDVDWKALAVIESGDPKIAAGCECLT